MTVVVRAGGGIKPVRVPFPPPLGVRARVLGLVRRVPDLSGHLGHVPQVADKGEASAAKFIIFIHNSSFLMQNSSFLPELGWGLRLFYYKISHFSIGNRHSSIANQDSSIEN